MPVEAPEAEAIVRRQTDPLDTLVRQLHSRLRTGSGTPEAAVAAPVGTLFLRQDGGASTVLYVKESGTGNTGWRAV